MRPIAVECSALPNVREYGNASDVYITSSVPATAERAHTLGDAVMQHRYDVITLCTLIVDCSEGIRTKVEAYR